MKNIFKFLGVAAMACSLMVACGSDDPENGTDTTPVTPTPATPTINVTFGSNSWEGSVAQLYTGYVSEYNLMYTRIFKEANSLPYVDMMGSITPGTYTAAIETATAYEGTDSAYTYEAGSNSMDLYDVQYGEQTQLQTQNGYTADWHFLNGTLTVSACDMNALTASYKLDATLYDYYSWAYALVNDVEDADTQSLVVDVKNYTFTNWSK